MHGFSVTAMKFLPSQSRFIPASSFCPLLCALVSVSGDDCGQLRVPMKTGRSLTTTLIIFLLFLAVIYVGIFGPVIT